MKWFRFYDEALDDPKVQRLSPVMFRHWINVLCIANRSNSRGFLTEISDVSYSLRVSETKARSIISELERSGLLDEIEPGIYTPHGWNARQRASDNVAERVAKHREKQEESVTETVTVTDLKQDCNVTVTLPHVRATEAETETDPPLAPQGETLADDRPEKPGPAERRWSRFWTVYPRHEGTGAARKAFDRIKPDDNLTDQMIAAIAAQVLTEQWTRDNGRFIPHASTWLNQRRWEDDVPPNGHVSGPPGVELLPGETAEETNPGEWTLTGADGCKRYVDPGYHGVVFDQRIHTHEGLSTFHEAVRRASSAHEHQTQNQESR